jgi:hypothetical protein
MFRNWIVGAVVFSAHLAVANQAGAATISAANCSATAVQTAINSAPSGSTVAIPAGTCTWSTPVTVPNTKSITIQGAGIGVTVIRDGSAQPILQITTDPTNFSRVTALTFDANGVTKSGNAGTVLVDGAGLDSFRIDHIHFLNIRDRAIKIGQNGNELSGVIDHNVFDCPYSAACQSITVTGDGAQESGHMGRPYAPGSNGYVFVEDNTFNYTYQNDGGVEGYGGARYVLRFNTLHGVTQGHHGADSGNYRGTQVFEIYGNTFDHLGFLGTTGVRAHHFRSGTGFVWNNSYTATYSTIGLDNYRSRDASSGTVWGNCDGTKAFDGNRPGRVPGSGWPCLDQVGWMFTNVLNGSSILTPLYTFLNRKGGAQFDTAAGSQLRVPSDIVENREFYNESPAFTGATGVGVGALAGRPTSCTTGVGYWAMDRGEWNLTNGSAPDGQFYKCTAPNTWTLTYTPYNYPHPLQFGAPATSGPVSPTNLRIVSH